MIRQARPGFPHFSVFNSFSTAFSTSSQKEAVSPSANDEKTLTRPLARSILVLRRTGPDPGDSRKELNMKNNRIPTRTLTGLALLTAIVVVLQAFSAAIRFGPFSITLALIPIVVGAALYGPWAGAWLGFVFGMVVLLSGDAGPFLAVNVLGTILTVLVKGAGAGFVSGLLYRLVEKKNGWLAAILGAFATPVTNTGLFLLGCLLFFLPTISEWGAAAGFESVGSYMVFGLVGLNFLVELLTILVLSPVIVRLVKIGKYNSVNIVS